MKSLRFRSILILLAVAAMICYLVFTIVSFSGSDEHEVCKDVEVCINDSTQLRFVTERKVISILKKEKIEPWGQKISTVDLAKIEQVIEKHPAVRNVECYMTAAGNLSINIWQKKPLFRVMSGVYNYYVDDERGEVPPAGDFVAYVPIVTGAVNKQFITNELYDFVVFLRNDMFWRAFVIQINICKNNEIELVPRMGDQIIFLGSLDNYETKLNNLMKLYLNALNKVGWNQYSYINLQYKNQIICTNRNN